MAVKPARLLGVQININHTDQQLMQMLACGDNHALNELMARYKQGLFRFIRRYVVHEQDAYELLQETFTKLYFKAASYKPEYRFSTWLFQIALNLCRDYGRARKVRRFFLLSSDEARVQDVIDVVQDPESAAVSSQALKAINQAIEKLPHDLKTALILFSLEGLSQEACAQLLGVTAKTVEMRVYRARKLLEKKLAFTR